MIITPMESSNWQERSQSDGMRRIVYGKAVVTGRLVSLSPIDPSMWYGPAYVRVTTAATPIPAVFGN